MYKIEKGIPIPDKCYGMRGTKKMDDFTKTIRSLEVGESFFDSKHARSQAQNSSHMIGIRSGKKFAVRSWEDGVRIWRVK